MEIADRPTTRRDLILGGNPDARAQIPSTDLFEAESDDFLKAHDLAEIGAALIVQHSYLSHLHSASIIYRWKAKGGKSQGQAVWGKCQKPSDLLKHFAGADFVIWLAADNLRDAHASAWTVEAVVHHELCHAGIDAESGEYAVRPHDFDGFAADLEAYGTWSAKLNDAARAFKQLGLGLDGAAS